MDLQGLTLQTKVPRGIREKIAKDEYFNLSKMYIAKVQRVKKSDSFEQHMKNFLVKDREPIKKSEIFELLYRFGFFLSTNLSC